MSNVQSYNALIDRFKAFASGHFILKSFSHGQIDTADLEKFTEYPFMHVVPSNVTYTKGTKTFSFQIVLADLPRDKDDKVEFQREVLSDLQRIAEDLVAEITNHRVLFGDLITVQNVTLEPFLEEFHNTLTGWTISLDLLVPYYWDACSIPAEWNDMFESGSGGTGSILTFIDSITRDEYGNVSLVNDEATPAPNYYYGTNDEGVRGWYLLTDEVGLTCATIGTCQTIIDIEAEIDLLQQDVTDLQADVVAIETELPNKVPYTGATANVDLGEYELKAGQIEFDTTPTGTAGAAVMRWNDTDGTVDVGLKGGNVTLQVGQESVIRVVNKAGADLLEANYQAVRVRLVSEGGAQGQRLAVVLALADTDADSATTIGLVTETINNNQEGFVTTSGEVRGINTTGSLQGETWVDGDILYLSGTTAGRVTNVKPAAPTHTIIIGYVVYAHANNGKIFVKVDNGYELDELHNVSITTPANNEVLTYESSTSLWKNKTVATALGYTPVPTTRSITINGTTQDLSADRTFTIATGLTVGTTPITSGTVGRVLFEGTGNVLQEDSALSWDNTNKRLNLVSSGDNLLNLTPQASGNAIVFNNNSYIKWGTIGYMRGFSTSTLFAVYNSGYTNIFNIGTSSACYVNTGSNFLIGTTTDAGYRLDVNGTARIQGEANVSFLSLSGNTAVNNSGTTMILGASGGWAGVRVPRYFETTGSISAAAAIARGTYLNQTLVATANNDVLVGLDIQDTFTLGAFTGVTRFPLRIRNSANDGSVFGVTSDGVVRWGNRIESGNNTGQLSWDTDLVFINAALNLGFRTGGSDRMRIFSTGNVAIATTTDAGYRLDVNGTARVSGTTTITPATLTGTAATSALDIAQTWNTTGTPIALKVNITDTASASNSDLMQLQVGGSTRFRVLKSGFFTFNTGGEIAGNLLVGGSSINASAFFEIRSTTRGFLPPRMTTTQKNAIASAVAGLVVYDSTLNKLCVYTGATWETITSA